MVELRFMNICSCKDKSEMKIKEKEEDSGV